MRSKDVNLAQLLEQINPTKSPDLIPDNFAPPHDFWHSSDAIFDSRLASDPQRIPDSTSGPPSS